MGQPIDTGYQLDVLERAKAILKRKYQEDEILRTGRGLTYEPMNWNKIYATNCNVADAIQLAKYLYENPITPCGTRGDT